MEEMVYVPHLSFGGQFGEFRWSIIHFAVLAILLNFRENMSSINQVRLLISKFYFKVAKTTSILKEVRELLPLI